MKTAVLESGKTIQYDKVTKYEETHPKDPTVKIAMYVFTRGSLGVVETVPVRKVKEL